MKSEIRLDHKKKLDEVVAWGFVHLERMDTGHWWLGIDTADGHLIMVNLWSKNPRRAINGRAEIDGSSDYATPIMPAVRVAMARHRRRINRNRKRAGLPPLRSFIPLLRTVPPLRSFIPHEMISYPYPPLYRLKALPAAGKSLCRCGHARIDHIYEEGPCRPGFVCAKKCESFKEKKK